MKKIFLTFLFFMVVFIAGCAYFVRTSYAKNWALSSLKNSIHQVIEGRVELEGFKLSFPLTLHADRIRIIENNVPILTIEKVAIELSLFDLLEKALNFKRLQAQTVSITRFPVIKQELSHFPLAPSSPSFLHHFLYPVKIGFFEIAYFDIAKALIPNEQMQKMIAETGAFTIKGTLSALPRTHFGSIDLTISAVNKPQTETHLFVICREIDEVIAGQISFQEPPHGIFQQLNPYPNPYGLSGLVHFSSSNETLDFDFDLSYIRQDPSLPEMPLLGHDGIVKGTATYLSDRTFIIESLQGKSDQASLQGVFRIDPNKMINSTFTALINNQASFPVQAFLSAQGNIQGSLDNLKADIELSSPSVKIHENELHDLKGTIHLTLLQDHPSIEVELDALYAKQSIHLFATANLLHDEVWNLSSIKLQSPFASASGNFYITPPFLLEGSFEGRVEDLTLIPLFNEIPLYGDATITGKLYHISIGDSGIQKQQAMIKLSTSGIASHPYRFGSSTVSLNLENIWKEPIGKLSFDLNAFSSDDLKLESLQGETTIDPTYNMWPFQIHGSHFSTFALESKGQWRALSDHLIINIDQLSGKLKDQTFKLEDPISFWLEQDIIDTTPIFISYGEGALYLSLDYNPQNLHLTTRVHQLPLEIFSEFHTHIPLKGKMDADLYLYGPPNLLGGQMHVQFQNVKIQEEIFAKFPPIEGEIIVSLLESGLEGSMNLKGITQNPLQMNLKLPFSLALSPFKLNLDRELPISAHLQGGGEIAPILQLFLSDMTIIHDTTQLAVDLSGTLANPQVSGNLTINSGSFEHHQTGIVLNNIHARLDGKGNEIILSTFNAEEDKGGKISAKGHFDLDAEKKFPFSLSLDLQNARLLRMDYAKGTMSGSLQYEGNREDSLIHGKLKMDLLQVKIPEQAPVLTETIDVIYMNQPRSERTPIYYPKKERGQPIPLDVTFEIPGTVQIKGKDLNSQWSGTIVLKGTTEAPLWNGELGVDYGVYNFNGKIFDINEGTITFAGDIEKKTSLYVIAHRDLGEIIAEVIVKGPIKDPLISFRSNPPRSQREILSWLLFNRGISDITPFQGAQLTQSISDLNQNQKGPDLLTKLRNTTGLDRIDISRASSCDSNEMSLQVGKYISKGVFVTLNKSFGAEANRVGIEANLGHEFKVEASVSDGEESISQILLKWKHDY